MIRHRFLGVPLALTLLAPTTFSVHAAATADEVFCGVAVPGYTTTRLTNNQKYNALITPLENNRAAWLEISLDDFETGKLVYFDGRTQRTLSERVAMDHGRGGFVAAGSDKIAWQENMGGDRLDIFFFDGTNVTRLTRPDGDITNRGVSVDASGNVAWVRTLSDPAPSASGGSTPTQLYGESRVMLWDGRSIQTVSPANRSATDRGVLYSTTLSHGALTWIAIESSQAHSNQADDRYSVYRYKDGVLSSHLLSDLPGGNYFFNYHLTDTGIVYEPKTTSADHLVYRSYTWATDTTTDIMHIPGSSDASFVANANRFGSTVFSPETKTYLWTGTEQREIGRLRPSSYPGHLNTSDIRSDGSSVLYTENTNSPSHLNQTFLYTVASGTFLPFTNTSESGGVLDARFGSGDEVYWTVFSSTTYRPTISQPTDICVARPVSTTTTKSDHTIKKTPEKSSPAPKTSSQDTCSDETKDAYTRTMHEAGQALKSSALVSFDVQVGYRLKASTNRTRLPSVRAALADARKKLVRDLDEIVTNQQETIINQLEDIKTPSSRSVSFTAFDTSWKTMTNSLLQYASSQDKKSILRILSARKTEIVDRYRATQSEMYTNTKHTLNICQLEQ